MKYLILEDFSGKAAPFLFPDKVDHEEMREQLPYGRLLAAGSVTRAEGGLKCYGGSPALGARSRPEEDSAIIMEALGQ